MKLNDPLVRSFEYKGVVYPLDLAFNRVLDVFDILKDDVLYDIEKAQLSVFLLTGQTITDLDLLVELWLYIKETFLDLAPDEKVQYDLKGNPMPRAKSIDDRGRLIDFEKDAEYIYASFQQAYGFSLFDKQDDLTWVEFKALLNALPDDTIMQRIIHIRSWKESDGGDRARMRALQNRFALEDREEETYG